MNIYIYEYSFIIIIYIYIYIYPIPIVPPKKIEKKTIYHHEKFTGMPFPLRHPAFASSASTLLRAPLSLGLGISFGREDL